MPETAIVFETVGTSFTINASLPGLQQSPDVAALATGNFVAVWIENDGGNPQNSDQDVRAQIISPQGQKIGPEILVNPVSAGNQQAPAVAALAGGGFVVAWTDFGVPSTVRAQVFDGSGNKVGSVIAAQGDGFNGQLWPDVAGLADGGFALVWRQRFATQQDPQGDYPVKLEWFNADGSPRGPAVQVNSTSTGMGGSLSIFDKPTVAGLAGGGLVVGWADKSHSLADASATAVYGQVYDASGGKVGGAFLANSSTAGEQRSIGAVALSGGGFAMTWNDENAFVGRAQAFDALGNKLGSELQAGFNVTALALPGNRFLLAWSQSSALLTQPYDGNGQFVDGSSFTPNVTSAGQLTINTDGLILIARPQQGTGNDQQDIGGQFAVIGTHGTSADDIMIGTGGIDVFYGHGGNDTLRGEGGDDRLYGGPGDDNLRGGAGVDSFDGESDDGAENIDTGFGDKLSFFERTATQGAVADLR
ncbi:MAG: hypothetical protein JOZ90_15990, partial [Alphaproteobacteria bacterium]|nr:hypothetical protein [Alphaproteobacteria bacterium]MBV9373340.1 hypothetical protein [Alphaproteobacteria bacterium]MBV9902576.1 hypothetical protein [Alphaproteobacteria bacterium]